MDKFNGYIAMESDQWEKLSNAIIEALAFAADRRGSGVCKDCLYWDSRSIEGWSDEGNTGIGRCRRNAPACCMMDNVNPVGQANWPVTLEYDGCGEFRLEKQVS
jgi:hypothetical protein